MSLLKHSAWNIGGLVIPSFIAIPTMGLLARYLGLEQFGLFTLAFTIVGYASIFDAGLTRAVIRSIAMNRNDSIKAREILGTSTISILVLALIAAACLFILAPFLPGLFKVSENIQREATRSFQWLSIGIPFLLLTQVWLAYLEGTERFAILSIYRTITSSLMSLFPLIFVLFLPTLSSAVMGLVISRLLAAVASYCLLNSYGPKGKRAFKWGELKELIRFGSWITISNIISPIMVFFDRFFISHIVGAKTLAFYSAPSDAVTRLLIIPGAVARALFPKLSNRDFAHQHSYLYRISIIGLLIVSVLIAVPIFIFSNQLMVLWMGAAFSGKSEWVLRILLIGFVFNSLSQIPYAQIQADGNSHITASIHLFEVIPYLIALYYLVQEYSIIGAAIAWSLRAFLDFSLLIYFKIKYQNPPCITQ